MEDKKIQQGFTLIEMLIAIAVFVIFLTILMGSYTQILQSQREADGYRVLYSESRRIMEDIREEVLISQFKYLDVQDGINPRYNSILHEVSLVDANGNDVVFSLDEVVSDDTDSGKDVLYDLRLAKDDGDEYFNKRVNSDVKIKDFNVFISPAANPYLEKNVYLDALQFQPKITVFIRFVLDPKLYKNIETEFVLQTTISSRSYMP